MRNPVDISVVVPALNEASQIHSTLARLQYVRGQGEIIVVDGDSSDNTVELARDGADQVIECPPGRAGQMNAGARIARGSLLWFVHADTWVSEAAIDELRALSALPDWQWGRFDIRLSGKRLLLRVIERSMNIRSRISGIATGDQGIFVRRQVFEQLGGFADIPLMEDIEICKRLRKVGPPVCLSTPLLTSSRRWETHGVLRTMLSMWLLRLRYALGASPAKLAKLYPSA